MSVLLCTERSKFKMKHFYHIMPTYIWGNQELPFLMRDRQPAPWKNLAMPFWTDWQLVPDWLLYSLSSCWSNEVYPQSNILEFFSLSSVPASIKTNNVHNYASSNFKLLTLELGIKHKRINAYRERIIGLLEIFEIFNKGLKKFIHLLRLSRSV